jgi:FixJ family two-component response regulator
VKVKQDISINETPKEPDAVQEVVFIIDDDVSVREGLSDLIGSLGFTVQAYSSAEEFLNKRPPRISGCIILDVYMPGMTGLELQRELKAANVYLPIIFLTGRGDIPMTVHALKAGAAHFLTKPVQETELISALQDALDAGRFARREKAEVDEIRQRFKTLAPREREVMAHVVSGRLNKQIAHEMTISERTVKLHRGRVMRKMGVESLAELVKQAEKMDLSEPGPKRQNTSNQDAHFSASRQD